MDSYVITKLTDWGFEGIIPVFKENAVDEEVFKLLDEKDIKELIPILGLRKKFEIHYKIFHDECQLQNVANIETDTASGSSSELDLHKVPTVNKQTAFLGLEDIHRACGNNFDFNLNDALLISPHGKSVVKFYSKNKCLDDTHRSRLVDVIIKYLYNYITQQLKHDQYLDLCKQIIQVFPTEIKSTYYIPYVPKREGANGKCIYARGRHVDKIRNLLHLGGDTIKVRKSRIVEETLSSDENLSYDLVEDAITFLKYYTEPWAEVEQKWKYTAPYRFNKKKAKESTVAQFLDEWPVLKDTRAEAIGAIIINGLDYDTNRITGEFRKACSLWGNPAQPAGRVNTTARLKELRSVLNNATSLKIYSIDAFLVTSDDEHQSAYVAAYDRRREYISGFSGSRGDAIITQDYAVLWTDGRYHFQADDQLNCAWRLMREGEMGIPTKSEWLKKHLKPFSKIGADPRLVPAYEWQTLEEELKEANIKLVEVKVNPIDLIWKDHEEAKNNKSIFVLDIQYAGVSWSEKVRQVRKIIKEEGAEAMVITALDEIAWLFNIRGRDIPYNPVVNSYVILAEKTIHMYVEKSKLSPRVVEHLNVNGSTANSVFVYEYDKIWTELPTMVQNWKKILLPTWCVFSKGVSQKILNLIPEGKRLLMESPIIFLKAKKNPVEIENMRKAHIKDAAAMCMFFSYFQQKAKDGHKWTEMEMATELNNFRFEQINSLGNSFQTIVGYKYNGAKAHYEPTFSTNVEIGHDSTIVIDSGGQYYEGTTDITRTIHYGTPNSDQINAYTRVLIGLIQFSTLTFPASMNTAVADVMARAPLWEAGLDYSHGTSHGVGSFLSVHESPINIHYAYLDNSFHLQPGYFLSVEPGYYVENYFGIRLENVLEVISKPWLKHISGDNFLGFQDVTLVPFEPKLINKTLLNSYHILWLNNYNTKIREYVGKELKEQGEVDAFYWMMKMTEHIQGSGNRIPCQLSLLIYTLFFQLIAHVS